METWSTHQLIKQGQTEGNLDNSSLVSLRQYTQALKAKRLPVVFTLNHLAKITDTPYPLLYRSVYRKRENANYKMFVISKRNGGKRHIHSVHQQLHKVHQFLNQEILQKASPHNAAQAFCNGSSIYQCAKMHCGARWLFQFDLQDFFYSINEVAVYKVFKKLGYRPLLAFELARLCTTTRLPKSKQKLLLPNHLPNNPKSYNFYYSPTMQLGVLPQGAATSPMLSNLTARKLDEALESLANDIGAVYTRYADDITLSLATDIPDDLTVDKIYRRIARTITLYDYKINKSKTRVAGPGSKKLVLGLLIDGNEPRLSKQTYKRIERLLYACNKFGVEATADCEGFHSALGFYNHLSGLIAYTKDVDTKRWSEFNAAFSKLGKIC